VTRLFRECSKTSARSRLFAINCARSQRVCVAFVDAKIERHIKWKAADFTNGAVVEASFVDGVEKRVHFQFPNVICFLLKRIWVEAMAETTDEF
jgi:hypothetical protein